ncbi:hypothetical protein PILCRDRAFT_716948 [Piloderma croceum F 1598]|uniref:Uncharacterized protein n=1 Tax=Piloderma croceum (strain F 1598) TaxID=765440 RepID=A0A0C3F1V9_PILCF|nr:hypothetical protein PILCRDRAFT_716948 [Piloderma croceum F 1598]
MRQCSRTVTGTKTVHFSTRDYRKTDPMKQCSRQSFMTRDGTVLHSRLSCTIPNILTSLYISFAITLKQGNWKLNMCLQARN